MKHSARTLAAVRALNAQCFGATDEFSNLARLRDVVRRPGSILLLSRRDGRIVGYNLITDRGRYLEGLRIGVHRDYRRAGIAAALLKRSIRAARERGKSYRAYVLASNVPSVNLHVRAGLRYAEHDRSSYRENPRLWFTTPPVSHASERKAA